MAKWGPISLELSAMSPGFDGWSQEVQSSTPKADSVPLCRNCSANNTNGQTKGFPEKTENAQVQDPAEKVGKIQSLTDRPKAIRSFKFALVEYLRDLLKPYWKNGTICRDAHKIIVKKSIDKVVESFGTSNIPTDKKIDIFLKYSRAKISKLVKEYVDKYKKDLDSKDKENWNKFCL